MINLPGFDTSAFLFRSEEDSDKRDEQYYLNNVQSLYSEYVRGSCSIGYSGLSRIEYLRSVANGDDPIGSQNTTAEKTSRKSSILDINGNQIPYDIEMFPAINHSHEVWDVISPIGKVLDALDGMFAKIDFDISADPLDPTTKNEVEDAKFFAWQYSKNQKKVQFAAQLAGVEVPEPDFIPEEPKDLDENQEAFLPAHCRYVELVVKHSLDISHWPTDLKKMFYRDLLTFGSACIKNDYDPATGKVRPRYVDPARADIQASDYVDCRDSERAWDFEPMSISRLRQYFPDEPEEFFKKIAGTFSGMFGNPNINMFSNYDKKDRYGKWGYDEFKGMVGNFEWVDISKTKEVIGTKHGRKQVKEVPLNKSVTQDKTIRFKEDRIRYQARWVVGTDKIFEYGPAYEITEPESGDTELTYKWIVLKGKSKVEQLAPILRNFQSLWDKYRELLRNSQGKIQFIDIDMLASTAGESDNPQIAAKKAFRRFLSTNKLLFRRINAAGMPNQNSPVAELDGGMGTLFAELQTGFQTNFQMVEYITGINPISMGQTADVNAPVTTSQMSMAATSNVLRPLIDGYMRMKQGVAENLARWIVMLVRGNEFSRQAYTEVIGEYGVQALITASKAESAYGFRLIARPNDLEKQYILQNIERSTTPGANGVTLISPDDGDTLINMVASETPIKTIQYFFKKARRRQQDALMAEKKALMETQSKLNQQDSAASSQNQQAVADKAHAQNMELQGAKNQGLLGVTATQEQMRTQKEQSVQELKNQGQREKESAPAGLP